MEEYAQFVDVEPLTAWERARCFMLLLSKRWPLLFIMLTLALLVGAQFGEAAAMLVFLAGIVVLAIISFPRVHEAYAYRAWERHFVDLESAVANYRQALAMALAHSPRGATNAQHITRQADRFCVDVLYTLGMSYSRLNRLTEAEVAFKEVLKLGAGTPLLLAELGAVLLRQGRDEDARATFDKALALAETSPNRDSFGSARRFKVAICERFIPALDPKQHAGASTIYVSIGDAYAKIERYQEAIAAYEHAIALSPQSFESQSGLGRIYFELGRYDEAIAAYQRALMDRRWPAEYYAPIYHNLGVALLRQERLSEAQTALEQAIALNRRSPFGYLGLARVYAEQAQYEHALERCQRAQDLAPSSPYPYISLGRICADQGRYEEAISGLERAMDLEPHTGWAWLERARLETLRGDTEAALEYLAQALERGPRHAIRRRALEEKKLRPLHDHPRFWELVGATEEPVR